MSIKNDQTVSEEATKEAEKIYNNKIFDFERTITADLTKIEEDHLEKVYYLKLKNSENEEVKQTLITKYKTELKNLSSKNIEDLQSGQCNLRIGKPIDNVDEHALVMLWNINTRRNITNYFFI